MGDVVEEAYGDAALCGREERGEDEPAGVGLEADVVDREIEGLLRLREKAGEQPRDVRGALSSVGQRGELDGRSGRAGLRHAVWVARSNALCARFRACPGTRRATMEVGVVKCIACIRVSRVGYRAGDSFLSPQLQRESIERVCQREGTRRPGAVRMLRLAGTTGYRASGVTPGEAEEARRASLWRPLRPS